MNVGLQVGDCNSKDAESGINSQDILNVSLMLDIINGFNLSWGRVTLLSSHIAMGTRSSISI